MFLAPNHPHAELSGVVERTRRGTLDTTPKRPVIAALFDTSIAEKE
jgi:hypothetical protein